ncbi:MAG: SDR family oxidoreductase [Bacteroidales bacterium]|nr:SDR family oxidoreductase [Bacteroidales bacterium]MCF8386916.1 SDR family oxidoreductase [Bacteroidales bacterium]MCF8396999.1 SDR family oxidoreductase [Bacteroidales bacterium]
MKIDFSGKNVLVTGSSRGIGKATAEMFAASGARVIVHYNNNKTLAETVLKGLEGSGHGIANADIANPEAVQGMVKDIMAKYKRIDVLVNNAGIYEEVDLMTMNFKEWQQSWKRTIETNLTGVSNLSFLVIREMVKQGGGRIVNVSSRGAFRGEPTAFAYGASKAGLNAMGQSMAKALAPQNVFVYTVAPGWVETDMAADGLNSPGGDDIRAQSPMKRVARPEEIARSIIYLASEGTEFMTGCILDVNGASYLRS